MEEIERELKLYAKELLDRAERDGIFRPLNERRDEAAPDIEELFETNYIVAVWRRTPYTLAAFPSGLTGSLSTHAVSVGPLENLGTVWRFIRLGTEEARGFVEATIEVHEVGSRPLVLTADLQLSPDKGRAAEWVLEPCAPFRGRPLDISLRARARDGRYLCSNEEEKCVRLLGLDEANERDPTGSFVWNIAWECSPEMAIAPDESLAFLDSYLDDDLKGELANLED